MKTKIFNVIKHCFLDVFIWTCIALVFLGGNYADNAEGALRFVCWIYFILSILYVSTEKTKVKIINAFREADERRFGFHEVYAKYSGFVEAFAIAFVGLPWTAAAYLLAGMIILGLKSDARKENDKAADAEADKYDHGKSGYSS